MDNIVSHLTRVYTEERTSAKTNSKYTVCVFEWLLPNSKTYKQEKFLNNEEIALLSQTVSVTNSTI